MKFPTTCTKCGFGAHHICERSVCCCSCHEPEILPEKDLASAASTRRTLEDLMDPSEMPEAIPATIYAESPHSAA